MLALSNKNFTAVERLAISFGISFCVTFPIVLVDTLLHRLTLGAPGLKLSCSFEVPPGEDLGPVNHTHHHHHGHSHDLVSAGETFDLSTLMTALPEILAHSLSITVFVLLMMLIVEYANIRFHKSSWSLRDSSGLFQYLLCAGLGFVPGCFGLFVVVTAYMHGSIRLGCVVAAAIATSGDEAFVMMAMNLPFFLKLSGLLVVCALIAGWITDKVVDGVGYSSVCSKLVVHAHEKVQEGFCIRRTYANLIRPGSVRALLLIFLVVFFALYFDGRLGHPPHGLISVLFFGLLFLFSALIILDVDHHFLKSHFFGHVIKEHAHRIFGWTFVAFLALFLVTSSLSIEHLLREQSEVLVIVGGLVGLIPDSGPHLLFFTLYQAGNLSFASIFANSIVQDGHGLLPLIAFSRTEFFKVKMINLIFGLVFGFLALAFLG